jgi:hypothetical protein
LTRSGLTSLKRQRRAFIATYHYMGFTCSSGLSPANGVQENMLLNALRLRFRLVASDIFGLV